MPLIFILLTVLFLGGNSYIYIKLLNVLSSYSGGVKFALSVLFWLGPISLVGTFLFRDYHLPTALAHTMYEVGTGWLVFTLYMVLFLLFFDLLKVFHVYVKYGFYFSLFLTLCLLSYGHYKFLNPKVQVINVPMAQIISPIKVVGVTDLHLGSGITLERLQNNIDLINRNKPDLIIISGDLIDNSVQPLYDQNMHEELKKLKAPLGIYMVPGNHEYISGIKESVEFINKTPIVMLKDSVVTLPNGIQIIGRDDRWNKDRKSLDEIMINVDSMKPTILLDHQPYELDQTRKHNISLQLSGHTHRGQVWPISLITDYLFEQSYGLSKYKDTYIYVSSGMSLWGPAFRIGTTNEMIVFNIIPK